MPVRMRAATYKMPEADFERLMDIIKTDETDANTGSTTAVPYFKIFQGFRLKPLAKLQSSCF